MKRIFVLMSLVFFMLGFASVSHSRTVKLSTFDIGPNYTQATKFSDDSVDHAENYGYSMELKISPHKNFRIGFSFNYTPLRVTEYDPIVALTRNGWYKWQYSVRNQINSFVAKKDVTGQPLYDIRWYYTTYYYNFDMLFNFEYLPIPEGRFQPYIGAGAGPNKFYTDAWIYSEWVLNIRAGQFPLYPEFSAKYFIPSRYFSYKKYRGWFWPGFAGAGFDLWITKNFGFQAQGRYLFIIKNHFRNKTNAYFRIRTGLVFSY